LSTKSNLFMTHVFTIFVLEATPHHTSLEYSCLTKCLLTKVIKSRIQCPQRWTVLNQYPIQHECPKLLHKKCMLIPRMSITLTSCFHIDLCHLRSTSQCGHFQLHKHLRLLDLSGNCLIQLSIMKYEDCGSTFWESKLTCKSYETSKCTLFLFLQGHISLPTFV
jgi:hypothetical protein